MIYSFTNHYIKNPSLKALIQNPVPLNKPVYGFAYRINDDINESRLRCKPVLGEVTAIDKNVRRPFTHYVFTPYKKNSTELRKSGMVDADSRFYADTYAEAECAYNLLVQMRIQKLKKLIADANTDALHEHFTTQITKPYGNDGWISGHFNNWTFSAKIYGEPSNWGIDDGRISKLTVRDTASNDLICCYSRDWDEKPADEHLPQYHLLINWLEQITSKI